MYVAEILLTKQTYDTTDWIGFVRAICKHVGGIQPITLIVQFRENHVTLFVESKKDISGLSGGIDGFMFRGADAGAVDPIPEQAHKSHFLHFPTGGTILDVKERYKLQESKQIKQIRMKIRRIGEHYQTSILAYMTSGNEQYVVAQPLMMFPAHLFVLKLAETQNYIFSSVPLYVSLEKTLQLLSTQDTNALFSVPGFPYSSSDYYLPLNVYQFEKHSLIVGASGSGKSRLIQLIIDRLARQTGATETYRIVVIDPHASLHEDLRYIKGSHIINLGNESAQLFPDSHADISAATELTVTLFQSLMADQYNPRLERVLRFSVFALLTAQIMSLDVLKKFLTDLDTRKGVLNHVQGYVPQNIQQFFATDFQEIKAQYYNEAISPIVSLVDEMQMQPSLVGEATDSLAKTVQNNFLNVFSLNKVSMGEKAVKTVAGLLIQQIFLIAQARALPFKLILIIDEVSVVQNPALAAILSEARKFNLSVILTQQYFTQVDPAIKDSILGNVVNYYVFRVSEEDAQMLEGNMTIELPPEIIERGKQRGQKEDELKVQMLTNQSTRECFVRVAANGQLLPAIRARTLDIGGTVDSRLVGEQEPNTVLQKLPPKMILQNAQNVEAAKEEVRELFTASSNLQAQAQDSPRTFPLYQEEAPVINIQQILADQSSSRLNIREDIQTQ